MSFILLTNKYLYFIQRMYKRSHAHMCVCILNIYLNILTKRLINNVLFFQKVVISIVASDEVHTQIFPLAHVTRTSGHEQWLLDVYEYYLYVISYHYLFVLHRNNIIYGVFLICSFLADYVLLGRFVYCSAVSCMNTALFLVCKLILYYELTIFELLNGSMVKKA